MRSAMQPYVASCMFKGVLVRDAPHPFSVGARVRRVLLAVDVDVLEIVALELAAGGIAVEAAPTIDACARALGAHAFDLLVLDLSLNGGTSLDLVRDLHNHGTVVPFVAIAGRAAVAGVVEAMRLGARTVIETRDPDAVAAAIHRELAATPPPLAVSVPLVSAAPARRWAGYVIAATDAAADPRTLADWSRAVGASRSVIIESCARLGIVPRDARDLARVLRLVRRVDEPWDPETALDVADRRTLRALLVRAGLTGGAPRIRPTPRQFLASQQFVAQTNAGLAALLLVLDDA